MIKSVEIYGASWCPHCEDSKRLCESKEIPVTYYDITINPERRDHLEERLGHEVSTIPQIFVNDEYLPDGAEELTRKIANLS